MTNQMHCSNCGSTDYEDIVAEADEGYTGCCNEPVCSCAPTDGTYRCNYRREG